MKVLIVGSGGREHALAHYFSSQNKVTEVLVCPGNAGIALTAKTRCFREICYSATDIIRLIRASGGVSFAIIGPEEPLSSGLVDALQAADIPVVGPSQQAAQLESSKIFAKEMMLSAGVPTAAYQKFTSIASAQGFIDESTWKNGWVIKADALAAGKGVLVCVDKSSAKQGISQLMGGAHLGKSIDKILIEERLIGREVSAFYLCLGEQYLHLGNACDYKRLNDGDYGPNTGGMGAYTPVSWLEQSDQSALEQRVVIPILQAMEKRGTPFAGFLFVGAMINAEGAKVLEFNVRLGDPEAQCLLPLANEHLLTALQAVATHDRLGFLQQRGRAILQRESCAVHVVCAATGYPGTDGSILRLGDPIEVTGFLAEQCQLTYAGVRSEGGRLLTNGGRVAGVTGLAVTQEQARKFAYEGVEKICFADKITRTDIAKYRG